MTDTFGKKYFEQNNYASYLERQERYERMVKEIEFDLFRKLKLDFHRKPVLDFGCAVGFVTKAFKDLGYANIVGYDVSRWAVEYGRETFGFTENELTHSKRDLTPEVGWVLILAFDVFEHMSERELTFWLHTWRKSGPYLLVRIPLARNDGGKYVLSVSENDPTHVMRFTRNTWKRFMHECGYNWLFDVNVGSFYDTDGVMCAMFRAEIPPVNIEPPW
jgi:cyclopropane fatty-acyl-phospholipid synthase-like methyltransferase